MITIISFILVFNVIVFIHEFGHFYVARKNGIRVDEFALGMGPAILKKQVGDTLYALRIIPLGGYCKMHGEDEKNDDPRAFNNKKAWQRFLVVFAGPAMNFILTIVIFAILAVFFGFPTLTIDSVIEKTPAFEAGIKNGDEIVSVNGNKAMIWENVTQEIAMSKESLIFEVKRNNELKSFKIKPEIKDNRKTIGIKIQVQKNPIYALGYSVKKTYYLTTQMLDFIRKLVTGNASTQNVVGPLGLAGLVGDVAKTGILNLLGLMAYISLNLGLMNLLPIPALDGGRLMFIIIEIIRGKPVPEEKEGLVHTVGFILLLLLFVFVLYNDIVRMFFS